MTKYFSLQLKLSSSDYDHLQSFFVCWDFLHWKISLTKISCEYRVLTQQHEVVIRFRR